MKTDRCVVRNQAYPKSNFSIRERHNERMNESYGNGDILPERSALNVHFKSCAGTYEQEFNRMVDDGAVSLRGLRQDAKVFDELVFDVNSAYFENHGGYEYAKQFFAEAYNLAAKEAGGEEYVLSAVLHADEKNKALSEQLGYDAFHYHLHVVYVPVVDKEIKWTKRCKDPALAGTVKETVKQVSHSKKWPRFKGGNGHWVNSYSLLQDRFYEHMKSAGYTDFERGERGSDAVHLSVMEYKAKQEAERAGKEAQRAAAMSAVVKQKQGRAAALDAEIAGKVQAAADLDERTAKKKKQLDGMEKKTAVAKQEAATFADIDRMGGKRTIGGNISVTPADWKKVSGLATEGVKSRGIIAELKKQAAGFVNRVRELTQKLAKYEGMGLKDSLRYYEAMQRAPRRLAETVADIKRQPPERKEPQRTAPERKGQNYDR